MAGFGKGHHLHLIDGSGFIFRAYHALPPLTRKSDGLPVGAVAGFCNMVFKMVEDAKGADAPTHVAVIFDYSATTFRNEIYPLYKAQRPEPPEDLRPQFALIRDATRAFNLPCIEMEGFEADDIIATYACQAREAGGRVTIISSDKDLMQLVGGGVEMFDIMKDRRIGPDEVAEKFGVPPEKVDRRPGAGRRFGGQRPRRAGDRHQDRRDADRRIRRSRHPAGAGRRDQTTQAPRGAAGTRRPDPRFARAGDAEDATRRCPSRSRRWRCASPTPRGCSTSSRRWSSARSPRASPASSASRRRSSPARDPAVHASPARPMPRGTAAALPQGPAVPEMPPIDRAGYEILRDAAALEAWIARIRDRGAVAVDTETTALDEMVAELVGVSLSIGPGEAAYLPLGHAAGEGDLFGAEKRAEGQMPLDAALALLKPMLEDPAVLKIGQNMKYDAKILARHGIDVAPIDDTMLISYALHAGLHGHGMDYLSESYLGHACIPIKSLIGSGKTARTFDRVPIEEAAPYAAEDAEVTWRLWRVLKPRLPFARVTRVYETLERPLVPVLAEMEMAGIRVDRERLSRLSGDFAQKMAALEAEIHRLAGGKFNVGSPKQLGEVLYDQMGLAGGRKGKTGAYATGADVLEDLAAQGHDLPARVLDWRLLSKLKSTYTDTLQTAINPETGRVHTSYVISGARHRAARLDRSEPAEHPRAQRGGPAHPRGLRRRGRARARQPRLFPDRAADPRPCRRYPGAEGRLRRGHRHPRADRLADVRRAGGGHGPDDPPPGQGDQLRGDLRHFRPSGWPTTCASRARRRKRFIDTYFERFPEIRAYMDATVAFAKEHGHVETLFGRRIHTPEINARGPHAGFASRAAINAPIQGSAADIIRRAMIRMPEAIRGLKAKMLLQVHDELLFEVAEGAVDETIAAARSVMEQAAAPAVHLDVPLVVDAGQGPNWAAAH